MTAIAFTVKDMPRSELTCEHCYSKYVIFRHKGSMRGNGHVKHLWCYRCKDVTAHTEVQST